MTFNFNFITKAFILILFTTLASQCVSSKKYNDAVNLNAFMSEELKDYKNAQKTLLAQKKKINELTNELNTTKETFSSIKIKSKTLLSELQTLQNDYDELLADNKNILSNVGQEKAQLNNKLSAQAVELDKKKNALKILEATLSAKENQLERLSTTLNDQQNKLKIQKDSLDKTAVKIGIQNDKIEHLNQILNSQNESMTQLKDNISKALLEFSEDELKTEFRDGKLYVSMSQELLFNSGSKNIDPKGISALKKLSAVLERNPDINIVIEGHTDSDGSSLSNWSLSVERAVSVVNILENNGVNPTKILASGKGEYNPLNDNKTKEEKALNRRTDIILSPDMNKILSILGE